MTSGGDDKNGTDGDDPVHVFGNVNEIFMDYCSKFGKSYSTAEEYKKRKNNFVSTLREIAFL